MDLFAGAGGLSLGFEQAGFDVLSAVEYDPLHAATHAFNFPLTDIICADVATVDAGRLRRSIAAGWKAHGRKGRWDGRVDAVIGGPPCQGFSVIGKRRFDDVRNQLVFHFARIVGELRPRYFVLENVPGMRSFAASRDENAPKLLDTLVARFKGLGYEVPEPWVLNAAEWGVPQHRRRLVLVGFRSSELRPAKPQPRTMPRPKRPRSGVDDKTTSSLCPTVWDAIGDLPDLDGCPTSEFSDEIELNAVQLATLETKASAYVRVLRGLDADPEDLSRPRAWEPAIVTSSYRTIHAPNVRERFEGTDAGTNEPVSRLFRLHPHGVCGTLRAGTHYERGSFNAPRPIHPTLPRVISVREAARLHSFPDWFRLHWTKWHGFRQVGNSLPPLLARAVGAELVAAMELRPGKPRATVELGDPSLIALVNREAAARFDADPTRMPRHALRRRATRRPEVAESPSAPVVTTSVAA